MRSPHPATARLSTRRAARRAAFETLENRQLMSGTLTYLQTDGPAAHTGDDPRMVVTADVNADGKVDLVTGNAAGLSVMLGDGTGHFTKTHDATTEGQVLAIQAADLNGDGKADLVIDEMFGDTYTLQGNGDGTFGAPSVLAFEETPDRAYQLVDMNGDGKRDFVAANVISTGGVLIRYNASAPGGPITFKPEKEISASAFGDSATVADVNGDGRPDLVGVGTGVAVMLNTGNDASTGEAKFGPAATYETNYRNPHFVAAADVTGDGKPDLMASYLAGDFSVLVNNGDGTFAAATLAEQLVISDGFADVNDDGKLDSYGSSPSFGPKFAVAHGNGDGTFAEPVYLQLGNVSFSGSAVADVNADGKADALVVDNDEDRVVVLLGGDNVSTPGGNDDNPSGGDGGGSDNTPADPAPTGGVGVDLTAGVPEGIAASLVQGDKVKASVTVTNAGDAKSDGTVTVRLVASTDGVVDAGDTVLATFAKRLKLSAGKAAKAALKFVVPAVGDGPFQVLAEVSGAGDAAAGNNTAAVASPVTFTTPNVDVAAGIASVPALKAGKPAKVKVDLSNAGGAPVNAAATVKLYATATGALDGQEVLLAQTDLGLSLKAGKKKPAKLSFTVPDVLAGQTRTLVATVALAGDANAANDVAAGSGVTIG